MRYIYYSMSEREHLTEIDRAYMDLAEAVVILAIVDYRKALAGKKERKIRELEAFFAGEWFSMLSETDPRRIVNCCRKYAGIKTKRIRRTM